MSTSTSTRTYQVREGNTMKTITEKTVTTPDGKTTTTREEKSETIGGGDAQCGGNVKPMDRDDFFKKFNDMKVDEKTGPSKSAGGQAPGKQSDVSLKDFRDQALVAHNQRRSKHKASPLKMSSDLNDYAQKWADHLAKTGTFQHSDCTLKGDRLGENIANKWSSAGADYTGEEAVEQWYSEISKYDYSSESNRGTGHFTQVVWKESKELGMGKAKSSDGKVFVVGSYRPPGNMMGTFVKNVSPPS